MGRIDVQQATVLLFLTFRGYSMVRGNCKLCQRMLGDLLMVPIDCATVMSCCLLRCNRRTLLASDNIPHWPVSSDQWLQHIVHQLLTLIVERRTLKQWHYFIIKSWFLKIPQLVSATFRSKRWNTCYGIASTSRTNSRVPENTPGSTSRTKFSLTSAKKIFKSVTAKKCMIQFLCVETIGSPLVCRSVQGSLGIVCSIFC